MKQILMFLFGSLWTPLFVFAIIWLISYYAIKQIGYVIHNEYVAAQKEFYKL